MMLRRPRFLARLAATLACSVAVSAANACGLEDPSSIAMRRGALNLAYPQSLHVGTAIWQAQLEDTLPRDPFALRGDLTPEARGMLRLVRAQGLLRQFAAQLARLEVTQAHPDVAVVLLGPVLWSRFESTPQGLVSSLHVDGPAARDVVAVTDLAVIEAVGQRGAVARRRAGARARAPVRPAGRGGCSARLARRTARLSAPSFFVQPRGQV